MKSFQYLLLAASALVSAAAYALPVDEASKGPVSYASHQVLSFQVTTDQQMQVIDSLVSNDALNLDVWSAVRRGRVDIRVPPESVEAVKKATTGVVESTVFIPDVAKAIAESENTPQKEGLAAADYHAAYHTNDEVVAYLNSLVAAHADKAKLVTLPTPTYEGRNITGISIGAGANKPVVFFHGAIHSREWISAATMTYFADQFLNAAATDATIKQITDALEIVIVPVANVDGYIYTHTKDRMWRKNRQPGKSCAGTDPNRNFGYKWGTGGSSSNECSDAYMGPKPFSTPEATSISQYITERKPIVYVDFHAYSQLLMTPFGYSCSAYPPNTDALEKIAADTGAAITKVSGTRYKTGPICETIYQASGSSIDWANVDGGVKYPFAVELRDTGRYGFLLPPSQIVPTGKETLEGFKVLLTQVLAAEKPPVVPKPPSIDFRTQGY